MRFLKYITLVLIVLSCKDDDSFVNDMQLNSYVLNRAIEKGAVIACAGSDLNTNDVSVFFYPEEGSSTIKLYETNTTEVDKNDYANYSKVTAETTPLFNGYLQKFDRKLTNEKWVIVTFELDGEIKLSNPIRTKQLSKLSIWSDNVMIDQSVSTMPNFSWINNEFGDNAIYFQVVSDAQNNLISGTYTFENQFQYYNTSNVVLNITRETPPALLVGTSYNFTLMDVSEDNWVNLFILNKNFIAQ